MSHEYSEDRRAQQTLSDFLQNELGWETAFAFDTETYGVDGTFGRLDRRQVVLPPHLDAALRRLNPGYTNDVYEQALLLLIEYSTAQTLEQINREKYHFFREGVPVVYRDENGKEEHTRLAIFDFEDRPGSNHFLAVREMWVEGEFGRIRPMLLALLMVFLCSLLSAKTPIRVSRQPTMSIWLNTRDIRHNCFTTMRL